MAAVVDSERNLFFEKQIWSALVKHTGEFNCAKAPRAGICDSHRAEAVLVLVAL